VLIVGLQWVGLVAGTVDYIDTTHDLTPEYWVSGLLAVPAAPEVMKL
jgi:hypothetical protein